MLGLSLTSTVKTLEDEVQELRQMVLKEKRDCIAMAEVAQGYVSIIGKICPVNTIDRHEFLVLMAEVNALIPKSAS